jgi:hypothetical protein
MMLSALAFAKPVTTVHCRHDAKPMDGNLVEVTLTKNGTGYDVASLLSYGGLRPNNQPNPPDLKVGLKGMTCNFSKTDSSVFSCIAHQEPMVFSSDSKRIVTKSLFYDNDSISDRLEITISAMGPAVKYAFDVKDCTVQ